MTTDGAVARSSIRRGRRLGVRPSGDDRQHAILATAERLLAERGLDAVTIDDLARGAGISRPTFYFHFASKDDVLLALLDRVIAELDGRLAEMAETEQRPVEMFRSSIGAFVEVFSAHRGVTAALYVRAGNPDVGRLWAESSRRWVAGVSKKIEVEREQGRVLTPIPSEHLATALILCNERVLIGAFAGDGPAVPAAALTDVLQTIWLSTIYGGTADRT